MLITVLNYTHTIVNVFLNSICVVFMVFLYRLQCFNYASAYYVIILTSFARAEHGSKLNI